MQERDPEIHFDLDSRPEKPTFTLTGPSPPPNFSGFKWLHRKLFWNRNISYLDQPVSGAGPFRENGIHYVRWSDVLFNFAGEVFFPDDGN
jgi:hypothetical protein